MNHAESNAPRTDWTQRVPGDDGAPIEELRERIKALPADFARADQRLRTALRERPLLALGAAVAAGFVVGRAIRRL